MTTRSRSVSDELQSPERPKAGRTLQTQPARALAALALSMLLPSLGISIPNVALPTFAEVFSASFQAVQWVVVVYLLAITVLVVSAGRLGDIMGHRRVLLVGILCFTAASLLCAVAPTLWLLIAGRALQGAAAAILMALTVALVRAAIPKDRVGSAMGLLGTMSAIGTALGPSLGGVLIAGPGWRAIFIVMLPLGALTYALASRYLPVDEPRVSSGKNRMDYWGTLVLGLTLASYALAVTTDGPGFGPFNVALTVAAVVGIVLFVRIEARAASPLIRLAAFRDAGFSASLAANALVAAVMMATLVVGPFFLSMSLGLNVALTGIVLSSGPIFAALSGVPAGRLVDRLGARRVVVIGLIQMIFGASALSVLPHAVGVIGYVGAVAILTPGYQLFLAANNTAVMVDVPADRRGVVSGMLNLSRNLGLISGAAVLGAVFAAAMGTTDIAAAHPRAIAFGMQVTFVVAAGLVGAALSIVVASRVVERVAIK